MNETILIEQVRALSVVYEIELEDDYSSLTVRNFNLPTGYDRSVVPVKLEIPADYPESPPGVGDSHVCLPNGLRYRGRTPNDYHENWTHDEEWAWWCYERINWDPCKDDLIAFFELLRAHMTEPP